MRAGSAAVPDDAAAETIALTSLPGIGPARARKLARLGLVDVRDLLLLAPLRVEAWPSTSSIAEVLARFGNASELVTISGTLVRWGFSRFGRRSLVRVRVADSSGEIDALFFNQPWLRERFKKSERLAIHGRVVDAKGPAIAVAKLGSEGSPLPEAGALIATYPATEGLTQEFLRGLCARAVAEHVQRLREHLSAAELARLSLPSLRDAARELHRPKSLASFETASRRVALERLLELQARLALRRRARAAGQALVGRVGDDELRSLVEHLPFELTANQRAVLDELRGDLARATPMRRLLQGDVGSGKTVLGLLACAIVGTRGGQAAFLAPTELLAEQHLDGLRSLLERFGLRGALLTGSLQPAARRAVLASLADGTTDVVFGTHALLGESVRFQRLALAVVDEQQRFGVAQRERLLDKGRDVHGLLMTATPIPRSLALSIYGDLDVSILRERPPGRGRIETRWFGAAPRAELETALEMRLARGEQAYWVVPRIDESDDGAPGARARFAKATASGLARFGVELVHGRMPASERAARLDRFRGGEARVLVATTVIEVGVDVPRATAIVIEAAERLGLAQLHQLRGRVGRSSLASACYLLGRDVARERLELLERTHDGFEIAERDLELRGMGDLLGLRQAGVNTEGLGRGEHDVELLLVARDLIATRPELAATYARAETTA